MTSHLPTLFTIAPRHPSEPVDIFQARLLQDRPDAYSPPVYLVTPYSLPRSSELPAYWTHYHIEAPSHEIMLVTDTPPTPSYRHRYHRDSLYDAPASTYIHGHPGRHVIFHGTWYPTDRALLSIYCATPIPVLNFIGTQRAPWPTDDVHPPLYVTPGSPEITRAWNRRWSPDTWESDISREYSLPRTLTGGGSASSRDVERPSLIRSPSPPARGQNVLAVLEGPPPPPRHVTTAATPSPTVTALPRIVTYPGDIRPSFVLEALVRDAISRHTTCPITLEPLTASSEVAVTSCYHIFDATALATWRASSGENKCPTCRTLL